eukprot:TRINITY_DN4188_c0_g1_i1.p2 TRINITY_DN4188_c0_g1~~TRINITY_DN4188_c0_g1_i1.p2  ORF type:complete len:300 (-),score=90.10 TRINITY_DN4188_c0_g1_i1:28-927(-)
MLHVFQPPGDTGGGRLSVTGVLLGLPAMQVWYWCTDQMVVQRVLSARSPYALSHARGGCAACGAAKLSIPFLMVVPGMAARLHLPAIVAAAPNESYPAMAAALLPHGLLGVMVAAMVSALMSSLASTFHSTATVVAYDLYGVWAGGGGGRGEGGAAGEARLVLVGRVVTAALMVVGVLWIPVIEGVSDQLYVYIQSVISYLAPPIAVVYVAAIGYPPATTAGALASLAVGFALGVTRFTASAVYPAAALPFRAPPGAPRRAALVHSNFLHFAAASTAASTAVLVGVSRWSAGPTAAQLA